MNPLRVLALVPEGSVPPPTKQGLDPKALAEIEMEIDVLGALKRLKHEVRALGVGSDLQVLRDALAEWKPDICFNMLEDFHGISIYDQHVVSFLELMRVPYTGCNPRGLMLARDKPLAKKILTYHRIAVPDFAVFPKGRKIQRPKRLKFPVLIKSTIEESSTGIAQASIVSNDEQLEQRAQFIHDQVGTDALAEEYIEGRELYVGILGNDRLQSFPVWELLFTNMPEDVYKIATARVKWNLAYQKKHGITTEAAKLSGELEKKVQNLAKRTFRALHLSGCARIDMRLKESGEIFVLEANPNPNIVADEEYSTSAKAAGIPYRDLVQKILNLGMSYRAEWKG